MCVDCPDEIQKWAGHARRQLQVNLVSVTPTKQIGEQEVLMITTRGLCCCSSELEIKPMDEYVVVIKNVPNELSISKNFSNRPAFLNRMIAENSTSVKNDVQKDNEGTEQNKNLYQQDTDPKYTIRLANELSNYIKTESIKSLNDPTVKLQKYFNTDFFVKQLELKMIQIRKGRELLNEPAAKFLPKEALSKSFSKLRKDKIKDFIKNIEADLNKLNIKIGECLNLKK